VSSDTYFFVVIDLSMLHVEKTVVSLRGSRVKIARFVHKNYVHILMNFFVYHNDFHILYGTYRFLV